MKFRKLPPDADPIDIITSANLYRRHLSTSQRAVIAAALANLRRGGVAGKPKATAGLTVPPLPLDDGTGTSDEISAPKSNSGDSKPVVRGEGRPVGGKNPEAKSRAPRGKQRKSPHKAAEPRRPDEGTIRQIEPLVSQKEAAQLMKVSPASLKKAKAIGDDPILKPALVAGTVSVDAAYKARGADDETKKRLVSGERVAPRTVAAADGDETTPDHIISMARRLLDRIALDPASSIEAQKAIDAERFLTPKEDALKPETLWGEPGEGLHVWLNPPTGEIASRFASRLIQELKSRAVHRACWLGPASFEAQWFRKLLQKSTAFATLNDPVGSRTGAPYVLICFRLPAMDVHEAVRGGGLVSTVFRPSSPSAAEASRESGQSVVPKTTHKGPRATAKK